MLSSDIVVFQALPNGRCGSTILNSGVVQNVFLHVKSSQRLIGLETHVKTFWGLKNTDNIALLDPEAYHDAPTKSIDDYVVMWLSTQRTPNTEAALLAEVASVDLFGSAVLAADIAIGALTFVVKVKHVDMLPGGEHDIFKDGYNIRVCSHSDALATNGAEEDKVIDGTPTFVTETLLVTITVTAAFTTPFTADVTPSNPAEGATRVSSLIKPPADLEPTYTAPVKTSGSGVIDFSTYPIVMDNFGSVEEDFTLTFTDATHFALTGDTLGAVDSGDTSTDFAPTNSAVSRPYFTLDVDALSGTWVAGDTITFTSHPARIPIGQLRVVPPLSGSLANNKCTLVGGGEAAA